MTYIEATTEQEKKIIECAQALIQAIADADLAMHYGEHDLSHLDVCTYDILPDKITVQSILNGWALQGDRNGEV